MAIGAKGRPGGPGGNKVVSGLASTPAKAARPGGSQKAGTSAGGPMKPAPGGSQPAGRSRAK